MAYTNLSIPISNELDAEQRVTVDTVDQKVLNSMALLQEWGLLGDNLYVDEQGILQIK